METAVIAFPRAIDRAIDRPVDDPDAAIDADLDAASRAIAEIDAAIELVTSRLATRVRLTAVPAIESAAATGLAHARAAGLRFTFERSEGLGVPTVTVGPFD